MKFSVLASAAVGLVMAVTPAMSTIYTTNPVASTSAEGGKTLRVRWQDDGKAPAVSSWGSINVFLSAGSESTQYKLAQIGNALSTSTTSLSYRVPKDLGPSGQYYFIRYESTALNGSLPYLAFSARFELEDMTGTFNSTVLAAAQGQEGSSGSSSPASSTRSSSGTRSSTSTSASRSSSTAAGSTTVRAAAASASSNGTASSSNSTSGADLLVAKNVLFPLAGIGAVAAGALTLL